MSVLQAAAEIPWAEVVARACKADPSIWAHERRGFTNAPIHEEWYRLILKEQRCAVIAPREHAKTEVFTVNQTSWRSIFQPGIWTYVFANTADQAKKLKVRVDESVHEAEPWLVDGALTQNDTETMYANGSRITVAGAGKSVRGAHPDVIIGDDVLEEESCLTSYQREKTRRWWFGTVSNMAHGGTQRVHRGIRRQFPPTKIFLVGTPFHSGDLLMQMKTNPVYRYYRYAAEFRPEELVPGTLAVEVA